jgi:bacteriocin biosynthesis cyclodehydratase domain-containing protein
LLNFEERLKIADQFTVIPIGASEYRLHSLSASLVLKGQAPDLLERLLPLLDGNRSVGEVLAELASFGSDAVRSSLQSLLDAGILDRAGENGTGVLSGDEALRFRSQIAFFAHFVVPPDAGPAPSPVGPAPRTGVEYQERLKRAHVAVFGLGRLGSQLTRMLAVAGIGAVTAIDAQPLDEADLAGDGWFDAEKLGSSRAEAVSGVCNKLNPALTFHAADKPSEEAALSQLLAGCDFAVLCPDHMVLAEYSAFNRAALASKTIWTSARFAGFEFHIGPTVIPGETPCYECFRLRINSNVADYGEHILLEEQWARHRPPEATLAIIPAAGLLALEVLKAVTWFAAPASYAHLYSLNLLTMQSELHPILKIPRCPTCGRPSLPRPTVHAWQQTRADPLS